MIFQMEWYKTSRRANRDLTGRHETYEEVITPGGYFPMSALFTINAHENKGTPRPHITTYDEGVSLAVSFPSSPVISATRDLHYESISKSQL